jgi:hypothetical protein
MILLQQGQTALSIAQKLGYISVVETLKVVTETTITTTTTTTIEEKYRVVAPEAMQETFMSDSEDEGGKTTLNCMHGGGCSKGQVHFCYLWLQFVVYNLMVQVTSFEN